jgi:PBP1b-binding outer membrane lipoprotein LpoB
MRRLTSRRHIRSGDGLGFVSASALGKQNKAKQNKTKQNKTKQNKTKQTTKGIWQKHTLTSTFQMLNVIILFTRPLHYVLITKYYQVT